MVALEGVVQSAPSAAQVDPPVALEVAQMEEDPVGGSSSVALVPHRVRKELPLAPLSRGSHSPARGEPPLQWMAAQDPTSALFSLDDHSESMEREGLDIGISTMLDALDQARGALREVVIPATQVFSGLSSFFVCFCVFAFLIPVFFLFRFLLLVAGINPNSSASRRRSGIASPRRSGYEQTWPPSLLPPRSGRPRRIRMRRRPTRCSRICR